MQRDDEERYCGVIHVLMSKSQKLTKNPQGDVDSRFWEKKVAKRV